MPTTKKSPDKSKPATKRVTANAAAKKVLAKVKAATPDVKLDTKPAAKKDSKANLAKPFAPGYDPRRHVPRTMEALTEVKRRVLAKTGMTPIDFLTSVYRDELYTDYTMSRVSDTDLADPKLANFARVWVPTEDAERIHVPLEMRVQAANHAAPYYHSKRPTTLNVNQAEATQVTKEQLRNMTDADLDKVLKAGEILGALPSFDVPAARAVLGGPLSILDPDEDGAPGEVLEHE